MWFQTSTRALDNNDPPAQAAPESALNPAFDYILKPGFSLLQKEIVHADKVPEIYAAAQYSEQVRCDCAITVY